MNTAANSAQTQTHNNPLKVGDILVSSWGYDQTNIEFYEVTKTTQCTVKLRRLQDRITVTGFMSGEAVPVPGHYQDDTTITRKIIKGAACDGHIVNIDYCATGFIWNGRPVACSWYA